MTAAERSLLLALFRWARSTGVRLDGALRWTSPPPHRWGVDFWPSSFEPNSPVRLSVWRTGFSSKDYWVASIAEAVDVLVALGIAPARFSTVYRAGWDASNSVIGVPNAHIADVEAALQPVARR